jgi:hypothetical protein
MSARHRSGTRQQSSRPSSRLLSRGSSRTAEEAHPRTIHGVMTDHTYGISTDTASCIFFDPPGLSGLSTLYFDFVPLSVISRLCLQFGRSYKSVVVWPGPALSLLIGEGQTGRWTYG